MRFIVLWTIGPLAAAALAQSPTPGPIDTCGALVQGATCVLFQADGGTRYVLPSFGNFRVGDAVRVVGTVTFCNSICGDADACISAPQLYEPTVFPCGEPLPNFPGDICTGVSSSLLGMTLVGLWLCRRGRYG